MRYIHCNGMVKEGRKIRRCKNGGNCPNHKFQNDLRRIWDDTEEIYRIRKEREKLNTIQPTLFPGVWVAQGFDLEKKYQEQNQDRNNCKNDCGCA